MYLGVMLPEGVYEVTLPREIAPNDPSILFYPC